MVLSQSLAEPLLSSVLSHASDPFYYHPFPNRINLGICTSDQSTADDQQRTSVMEPERIMKALPQMLRFWPVQIHTNKPSLSVGKGQVHVKPDRALPHLLS